MHRHTALVCVAAAFTLATAAWLKGMPHPQAPATPPPLTDEQLSTALDDRMDALRGKLHSKEVVLAALAEGRLRLDEAVARALALEADRPDQAWSSPGPPDPGAVARNLVGIVLERAEADPDRALALGVRLNRELAEYVGRPAESWDRPGDWVSRH